MRKQAHKSDSEEHDLIIQSLSEVSGGQEEEEGNKIDSLDSRQDVPQILRPSFLALLTLNKRVNPNQLWTISSQ